MGELVSFPDAIERVGCDFTRAASQVDEVLAQLQQVRSHVRDAFHNHPDEAGPALASIGRMHDPIERVQQLASALGGMLVDVAASYRRVDHTIASGWHQAPDPLRSGSR